MAAGMASAAPQGYSSTELYRDWMLLEDPSLVLVLVNEMKAT